MSFSPNVDQGRGRGALLRCHGTLALTTCSQCHPLALISHLSSKPPPPPAAGPVPPPRPCPPVADPNLVSVNWDATQRSGPCDAAVSSTRPAPRPGPAARATV